MPMRSLALLSATALAACAPAGNGAEGSDTAASGLSVSDQEGEAGQAQPGSLIVFSRTAWLSIGRDGSVYATQLDPDGSYRDFRDGSLWQRGRWQRDEDGSLCFSPAAADGVRTCWRIEPTEREGVIRAEPLDAPETRAIELRRLAWRPPAAAQDAGSVKPEGESRP